ncbi:cytochrome c [bacterium]|nr:cytochrome c [bacterium]
MRLRLLCCTAGLAALVGVACAEDNVVADPVAQGKVLAAKKCKMCHAIDGAGGKKGALNGMAEGKTDEWLTGAILDPKTTLGDNAKMPAIKVSEEEAQAIAAYMKTLQK